MNKKILIATGLYPPESGGPATYTKLLEERLPALGFEVHVLPFNQVRHLPKGVRHVAYFLKCVRIARKVDIVYAQDTVSVGFPAALAAMCVGTVFVVRVPGDYVWEQAQQRFGAMVPIEEFQNRYFGVRVAVLRAVQRFVVGRATRIVAPSEYLRALALRWGVAPEHIIRIFNGIELPVPTDMPHGRPAGFLVVSVGRRVPWKGFEALERVVSREKDWTVRVIDNVSRAQALGWVKVADVFVLNSSYEGLSHLLIEAMSLGVPIIATNVGGNPELVRDGVEGLLIPPQDDEALYAALKKVEQDKERAHTMGEKAAQRAKEFSAEQTAAVVAELFNTL